MTPSHHDGVIFLIDIHNRFMVSLRKIDKPMAHNDTNPAQSGENEPVIIDQPTEEKVEQETKSSEESPFEKKLKPRFCAEESYLGFYGRGKNPFSHRIRRGRS
jgi:hypothetical protein